MNVSIKSFLRKKFYLINVNRNFSDGLLNGKIELISMSTSESFGRNWWFSETFNTFDELEGYIFPAFRPVEHKVGKT